MTGRDAGELRLGHVPDSRVNPDEIVELRTATRDVEYRDLRPERMRIHVGVSHGCDPLPVHDGHILGADSDEVLDAYTGRVVIEEKKRLLARTWIDAVLRIGGKPRIQARSGDEDIL